MQNDFGVLILIKTGKYIIIFEGGNMKIKQLNGGHFCSLGGHWFSKLWLCYISTFGKCLTGVCIQLSHLLQFYMNASLVIYCVSKGQQCAVARTNVFWKMDWPVIVYYGCLCSLICSWGIYIITSMLFWQPSKLSYISFL